MRQRVAQLVDRLAQLLLEPPAPPAGFWPVHTFRPSPKLRNYSLTIWCSKQAVALASILAVFFADELFGWSKWFAVVEEIMDYQSSFLGALPDIVATLALIGGVLAYILRASFTFAESWLKLRTHWYMLGHEGLYIREGFQHVHELTIRFANIQQVTLKQNLLQRVFGIADVEVQTAGGTGKAGGDGDSSTAEKRVGHVAVFRSVDNAEGLRDMLRRRLGTQGRMDLSIPEQPIAPQDTPTVLTAADTLLREARALRKTFTMP